MEANAIAYSQAAYAANRASLLPKQPQKLSGQSGSRFQSPMLSRQSNLCRTQIVACKPTFLVQKCNGFAGKSLSSLAWGSSQFLRKPEDRPLAAQIRIQLKRCNKRFSFKPTAAVSGDAAAVPGDAGKTETEGGIVRTLQLGALFGMWYLFNIYFNIYNKQVLKVFPFPVTITELQFLIGSVVVLFMWTTGLYKKPNLTKSQLLSILPLAMVHTLGNLFTNMSLGKVAVSFTHTIKAMEPFFSVLLSTLVLGEVPNPLVLASLVPIVGGVALASITEASFNWAGFLSAMASNVTFQSRNVLSKKFMVKKEGSLDNINLFSVITIMSFFLLAPVALLSDGVRFTPANLKAAGLDVNVVVPRALMAGLCFHSYQQVSYMILQRVSPVTHSVGNCVKRVVVIVTSVLFFKTPVSPINALGTGVALAGVFGYSRIKQIKPKKAA